MNFLELKRDENFKEIGQCLLQKKYYEERIEKLLTEQERICAEILEIKRNKENGND